jgi:predicted nucleic acid-binding protein
VALLIDTGPLELLRRRDRRVEALALQHYPPVLPVPVVGEFLYGQLLAGVAPEALLRAQEFLGGFEILHPDAGTALTYARLRSQAKRAGQILPDADLWIAALALQHQTRLVTMDSHFDLLPDLAPWLIRV